MLFVGIMLALNYNGNVKFEQDFKTCENNEWTECALKLYNNSSEMWRLYTIKDRLTLIRGFLYYNLINAEYTDGQILANFYIITPFILSKLI